MIASHRRRVETPAIRCDSYAPEMADALSLRYTARINLSMGLGNFQMFVEIVSRMGGRGVGHETRRDVSRGRKRVIYGLLYVEYRLVCVYPRARRVDDNTGETIALDYAEFVLPGFIPRTVSEPISRCINKSTRVSRLSNARRNLFENLRLAAPAEKYAKGSIRENAPPSPIARVILPCVIPFRMHSIQIALNFIED